MRLRTPSRIQAASPPCAVALPATRSKLGPRLVAGVVAGGLVVAAMFLPVWQTRLMAPQYPGGLGLDAYGDRVAGDVREINSLNHYIGMRPFDPADVPEMRLWIPALVAALLAVGIATVVTRRLWSRLARLYVWLLPVGVLGVIQIRLYQYGHDLDPKAALRLDPFTPWVVGPTKVWNFEAWARPGTALICILVAGAVLSFGPRLVARLGRRLPASAGLAVAAALLAGVLIPPGAGATAGADLAGLLAGATPGDRVVVPTGSYHGNIVVDRSVVLEGRGRPHLLGDGKGTVLRITAPDVVVRGFRVSNSGPGPTGSPAGIRIEAAGVTVEDVWISDVYTGIDVVGASGTKLVDNLITGRAAPIRGEAHAAGDGGHAHAVAGERGDGISLWNAEGALVRGNRIEDARDGIFLSFGSDAFLDGNIIEDSRYGVHSMYARSLGLVENDLRGNKSGAVLMYGGPVLVLANRIHAHRSPSTGFGILLKDVEGVETARNVVVANRVGLHVDGSPSGDAADARFVSNTIARNDIGVALMPTARGTFSLNSFVDNNVQILPKGRGVAGKSHWMSRGAGNHWSNYRGVDRNGDGFGELAHHEAATVPTLVARDPIVGAFASSPGFRIAAAVWDRWIAQEPLVTDLRPLVRPHSPPFAPVSAARGIDMPLVAGGLVLAFGAAAMLRRLRQASSSHPMKRPSRRILGGVHAQT